MMELPTFLLMHGLMKLSRATRATTGRGQKLAAQRLALKRKANRSIPSAARYTRQQARRERLKLMKALRAQAKAEEIAARQARQGYRRVSR